MAQAGHESTTQAAHMPSPEMIILAELLDMIGERDAKKGRRRTLLNLKWRLAKIANESNVVRLRGVRHQPSPEIVATHQAALAVVSAVAARWGI